MTWSVLLSSICSFCSSESPLLWLRVDPEMEYLAEIHFNQPVQMWVRMNLVGNYCDLMEMHVIQFAISLKKFSVLYITSFRLTCDIIVTVCYFKR